jgi:RHS repeat-associated protein
MFSSARRFSQVAPVTVGERDGPTRSRGAAPGVGRGSALFWLRLDRESGAGYAQRPGDEMAEASRLGLGRFRSPRSCLAAWLIVCTHATGALGTYAHGTGQWTYYLLKDNFSIAGTGNSDGLTINPLDYAATGDFSNAPVTYIDGDWDRDGDVDLTDFQYFQASFNGPNRPPAPQCTVDADFDDDGDVDLTDFQTFQQCFNGPNRPPASPSCYQSTPAASGTFALQGRPVDKLPDGEVLQDNRWRTLRVKDGRWLQRDRSGFGDGANLYESFRSNPARFSDPEGLDSVVRQADGSLLYVGDGFYWTFARPIPGGDGDLVVIDHPNWWYAFEMKRSEAEGEFDRWFFQAEFSSPFEIMRHATMLAARPASPIVGVFDKRRGGRWVSPESLEFDQLREIKDLAREGIAWELRNVERVTRQGAQFTMGALAGPGGAGAMGVDLIDTTANTIGGRIEPKAGVALLGVGLALTFVHARAGAVDDAIGGAGRIAGQEARAGAAKLLTKLDPPPGLKFGTTRFGNAMHAKIAAWLQDEFPGVTFELRVRPGETGVDVKVLESAGAGAGFKLAEIKPRTPSGQRTLGTQVERWGLKPGQVVPLTYDAQGNVYAGF